VPVGQRILRRQRQFGDVGRFKRFKHGSSPFRKTRRSVVLTVMARRRALMLSAPSPEDTSSALLESVRSDSTIRRQEAQTIRRSASICARRSLMLGWRRSTRFC
jgi:hypothetical protein